MLSEFVTKKLTRLFHLLDANNNGALEQADYDRVVRHITAAYGIKSGSPEFAKLRQQANALWRDVATVGGGDSVTLVDWLQAHAALHAPDQAETHKDHLAERAMLIFELQDRDKDGRVTEDELRAYVQARFGLSEAPWVSEAFARTDVDGNGFITVEEVIKMEIEYHFSEDEADAGNYLFGSL